MGRADGWAPQRTAGFVSWNRHLGLSQHRGRGWLGRPSRDGAAKAAGAAGMWLRLRLCMESWGCALRTRPVPRPVTSPDSAQVEPPCGRELSAPLRTFPASVTPRPKPTLPLLGPGLCLREPDCRGLRRAGAWVGPSLSGALPPLSELGPAYWRSSSWFSHVLRLPGGMG